jgi:hypothetical protein
VRGASSGPAVVTVESAGKPVTVSQIVSRMSATGVAADGTVTVIGVTYKDLCVTPCTFEVKPGPYELGVHGSGVSGATNQFDLRSGPYKLRADPGSAGVAIGGYFLTITGGVALVTGVVFLFVSDDIMDFPAAYNGLAGSLNDGKEFVGVIAQEVEQVAPFMVTSMPKKLRPTDEKETSIKQLDANAFIYMLINAVQELSEQNEQLKRIVCKDHPNDAYCMKGAGALTKR